MCVAVSSKVLLETVVFFCQRTVQIQTVIIITTIIIIGISFFQKNTNLKQQRILPNVGLSEFQRRSRERGRTGNKWWEAELEDPMEE